MKTTRMVLAILTILSFFLVMMQSCAVGVVNTFSSPSDMGGSAGAIAGILSFVGAIIALANLNSGKPTKIAGYFYLAAAFYALPNAAVYKDLIFWGLIYGCCGGFYVYSGRKQLLQEAIAAGLAPAGADSDELIVKSAVAKVQKITTAASNVVQNCAPATSQTAPATEAAASGPICPVCQRVNKEGAKFCAKCGEAFFVTCPKCGKTMPKGEKYCEDCGTRVDGAKTCTKCGNYIEQGEEFCPECGTKVPVETKGEAQQ